MIAVLALFGGLTYRWRGSGWPANIPWTSREFPHTVRRASFALALVCASIPALGMWTPAVLLCWPGLVTGHGSYYLNNTTGKSDEPTGPFVMWLANLIRVDFRHVGMAVTGLAMTVPVGIASAFVLDAPQAVILALSGGVKAIVYAGCYRALSRSTRPYLAWSAWAEFIFGATVCFIFAMVSHAPAS